AGLAALRPLPRTIGVASGPCRPASDEPKRRHLLPSPERPCRRPSGPRPRPSAWAGTRRRSNLRSAGVFFLPFPSLLGYEDAIESKDYFRSLSRFSFDTV